MFIIKVERKKKDDDFTFEDIKKTALVFHKECSGGKVEWVVKEEGGGIEKWLFKCKRCGASFSFEATYKEKLIIIKTTIDGLKRNINENMYIIQQ